MISKEQIAKEFGRIIEDAIERRDLDKFEMRFAIATAKLEILAEEMEADREEYKKLLSSVKTLDEMRRNIGNDPEKAHCCMKMVKAIVKDDYDSALEAVDEFTVTEFLRKSNLMKD